MKKEGDLERGSGRTGPVSALGGVAAAAEFGEAAETQAAVPAAGG